MSILRIIYLSFAIVGFYLSISHLIGLDESLFSGLQSNLALNSYNSKIALVNWVLTVWIVAEIYIRRDYWVAPICIGATFILGIESGLAFYLFLRIRPLK